MVQVHRKFLDYEWCNDVIENYKEHFTNSNNVLDQRESRYGTSVFTLPPENPLYREISAKFSPLVGYEHTITWINITVYEEGSKLPKHIDTDSSFTFVASLNENYEGGRFVVSTSKEKITLNQGDLLTFNGNSVYHSVETITKGRRFSLNMWTVPKNPKLL